MAVLAALEGSCESVPKVGDVQAGLAFGQAHYDWAQTRFEDLGASADELATWRGCSRARRTRSPGRISALSMR